MSASNPADAGLSAAHGQGFTLGFLAICAGEFGAMTSFNLLFSVTPLFAASLHASPAVMGWVTGTLMFATVCAELSMPVFGVKLGARSLFVAGQVILAVSALAFIFARAPNQILAICALRGVGLGLVMVAGSSLVAAAMSPGRRSRGLGLYGVVSGVPAIVALPLGPWLVGQVGYTPLFWIAGLSGFAGLMLTAKLPFAPSTEVSSGLQTTVLPVAGLAEPTSLLLASALAAGVITTFLPTISGWATPDDRAIALIVYALAAIAARGVAGWLDVPSRGVGLAIASVAPAALGLAFLLAHALVWLFLGAALIGVGFGSAQNTTLTWMFQRMTHAGGHVASMAWNIAFDAGLGLGAVVFGSLALSVGVREALIIVVAAMGALLLPSLWRLTRPHSGLSSAQRAG